MHLLLTGASGLVGSTFLSFVDRKSVRVSALTHRRPVASVENVTLDSVDTSSVTAILHSAADTRFDIPIEESRAANVELTRSMIEIARRCPKLERFGFVSSAFACGRETGVLAPTRWSRPAEFSSVYQQTKWESEELVFEAMKEIPASVYRLSAIFGDAATGEVRQYNYTHQLLKFLARNMLPVAPVDAAAPVDLIASDWVSAALYEQFMEKYAAGSVAHLCMGPERALSVGRMIELAVEAFEKHGREWLPIRVPRMVSLEEYRNHVAAVERRGEKLIAEMFRLLETYLPHLALRQEFVPTPVGAAPPDAESFFSTCAGYAIRAKWR